MKSHSPKPYSKQQVLYLKNSVRSPSSVEVDFSEDKEKEGSMKRGDLKEILGGLPNSCLHLIRRGK